MTNLVKFGPFYRRNVSKVSKMYRNFQQMSKILKITVNFQKFRYIFMKFYTGKVGIIFRRFSTVKKIRLLIFGKVERSKISGKRMALIYNTLRLWRQKMHAFSRQAKLNQGCLRYRIYSRISRPAYKS